MKSIKEAIVLSLCLSLIFSPTVVLAAPQGGKVVGGSASIHQSGTNTTINQSSDRAVINWNSFDIAKHEAVRHNMPSSSSAALHRVVGGGGASQIQGLLQSNGNIYLVNPAGVVIHKGARVDTNGFIATTRDIADSNFMKGKMVFDKPGLAGAQIINKGEITVKDSGLAALVAPSVRNEGLIAAKLGKVALAAGEGSWSLDMHGDDLITFTVDENAVNSLHGTDGKPLANIENSGSIKAEGGVVVLTAAQLDGIVGSVVNSGEISAASAEISGGMITFKGQGSGVDISNTGTLDVSSAVADAGSVRVDTDGKLSSSGSIAATGGKKGGKVTLTGQNVALKGSAKIDASGNTGGGTVLVGGNALGKGPERNAKTTKVESGTAIHADAKIKGDGGQVVVWSDEKTSFDGTITAKGGSEGGNGGHVETSAKSLKIGNKAQVNTLAPKGLYGKWLLDPADFVVADSGGDISGTVLSMNLEKGDVIIESIEGVKGYNGDITINDKIEWFSNSRLTLKADLNIRVYDDIILHGDYSSLSIMTRRGDNIFIDNASYHLNDGKILFLGNNNKYFINNNEYKLIRTIEELQNIDYNYKFHALAHDIDASSTKTWNGGCGFVPLEGMTGIFNGGNNIVKNIFINYPDKNSIGLFGWARSLEIRNLGLLDINICGHSDVGGLIGTASGSDIRILNIGVTGDIYGVENVGGVVGKFAATSGGISSSYSKVNVTGENNVGGFAGFIKGLGPDSSYSTGNVNGINNVGGFVGFANGGRFLCSYSQGDLFGNALNAGGFVGYAENSAFQECYSTGKIIPSIANWNHGFIGNGSQITASNSYVDIDSSYSTGDPLNGYGVSGVSTAYMKNGNVFRSGYPWIEDGINYPALDIYHFTFNDNKPGDTTSPGTGNGTTDPGTGGGTTNPGTGGGTTDLGTGGGTSGSGTGGGTIAPDTNGGTDSGTDGTSNPVYGKDVIYADNDDIILIDLNTKDSKNKIIINKPEEEKFYKNVINNLTAYCNKMGDIIYDCNAEILRINTAVSAFTSIIGAVTGTLRGDPYVIIESIGGFITNGKIAESVFRLIFSDYFFSKAQRLLISAEKIINSSVQLSVSEQMMLLDDIIDARICIIIGESLSLNKINEMYDRVSMPWPQESLAWSLEIASDIVIDGIFSGLGEFSNTSVTKLTQNLDVAKRISKFQDILGNAALPFAEGGKLGYDYGILLSDSVSTITNAIDNDLALSSYIDLYNELSRISDLGIEYI